MTSSVEPACPEVHVNTRMQASPEMSFEGCMRLKYSQAMYGRMIFYPMTEKPPSMEIPCPVM
jgi:hypothetical protein